MQETFRPYYEITEEVHRGEDFLEYTYKVEDDNLATAREKAFCLLVDRMESVYKLDDAKYETDLDIVDLLRWDAATILEENGYTKDGSGDKVVHEFVESDNAWWKLELVTGLDGKDRFDVFNSNLPLFGLLSGTVQEGSFVTQHSPVAETVEQQ